MKRPPGLWILLSAGVLWLRLQDVYGLKATSLIFAKSTTSTSTEDTPSVSTTPRINNETANNTTATPETTTSSSKSTKNGTSTNSVLTGIPQIDYIWDPNLPLELKGYNLSEYPFYERVPFNIDKETDFKCDGLHDGFYASIFYKCQVYHHCLAGTRYDFLCGNYTAFDQKTFICQFVSKVDCENSPKFWHRNDNLYKATTTSTAVPLRANIYTTAPPGEPITPRRPTGGRPHRPRRRRPQIEYYDDDEYYDEDYYEDRPRSNRGRKRTRPRPRPTYDDDDEEEYEDDRYESRRGGGRRRPYRKRNQGRKKLEEEDEPVDDRFEDEDFIAASKRPKNEDKPKPPIEDDTEERPQKRPSGKRRYPVEKREQDDDYDRKPPRKTSGSRRPIIDDYEDELPQSDDSRNYEQRPRKKPKGNQEQSIDGRPIIIPTTGTIYDRPRVAPKINRPVPKNQADKYAFKPIGGVKATITTTTTKAPPLAEEDEYLDQEYEEPLPKRVRNRNRRPAGEGKREKSKSENFRDQSSEPRPRAKRPEIEETSERPTTGKPKYSSGRNRHSRPTTRKPVSEYYYDEDDYLEEEIQERRPFFKSEKKPTTTTSTTSTTSTTTTTSSTTTAPTTTSTTGAPPRGKDKYEPVMRIIKRPFLPSRGGSPYSARGLQPVGLKAVEEDDPKYLPEEQEDVPREEEADDYYEDRPNREKIEEQPIREEPEEVQNGRRPYFKPSPVVIKVPIRQKYNLPSAEAQELIDSEPSYQQTYKTKDFLSSNTTPKQKVVEKNPLDLDYDVNLNDALNTALPNLPVRSFPTGFSSANDYNYNSFTRPRYVSEPDISPANQNYVQQNKVVRSQQRYERVPQNHYSTINGGYRQPAQTQAIYSSY